MPNDSSTGGLLPGTVALGLQDDDLDEVFQQLVAGLTGLDGSLVRPRWQAVVPKQPEPATDWCAIGITDFEPDDYPVEEHVSAGNGSTTQTQWETMTLLASLYGPNAGANASALRNGLYVSQNRETLTSIGMDLVDAMKPTVVPDFVNQQWVRRFDVLIRIRRAVQRTYPILNLLSAPTNITRN